MEALVCNVCGTATAFKQAGEWLRLDLVGETGLQDPSWPAHFDKWECLESFLVNRRAAIQQAENGQEPAPMHPEDHDH